MLQVLLWSYGCGKILVLQEQFELEVMRNEAFNICSNLGVNHEKKEISSDDDEVKKDTKKNGTLDLALFGVNDDNLADCLWLSWTYVADSDSHTNTEEIGPRLVSVSISFGGMLIFAIMLGLVSDAISEKFDSLRNGRSNVVEKHYTLILGWSDKLGSLLNQLDIANESLGGGTVVVMAERDK